MSLPCESFNIEIDLLRATRGGPGNDVTLETALVTGQPAIFTTDEKVLTSLDSKELSITGVFWIDPCDSDGDPIDVKKNDWVQYTNYRDRRQREERIHDVFPVYVGTQLDHLRLVVTGG